MLDERKQRVLRAIVEDYISTHEPVGSKNLVERYNLGVSPATVRNDMAALEDEGYIAQPHTSAGRVPTDAGYRLFVDRLASVKPMTPAERRAITKFLAGAVDLDDVVNRAVRLLAQLTRQVAIVQYPTLTHATVRHVELVTLSETRLMLVLIMSSGRVEQRVIELTGGEISQDDLSDLRTRLNAALVDHRMTEVSAKVVELTEQTPPTLRALATVLSAALLEMLADTAEQRVVVGGAANLSRYGDDFDNSIRPVLEALEEHMVLLRLLGEATSPSQLVVRIGHENPYEQLATTSVVASGYGSERGPLATLGIVGPTHMDYPGAMGSVRAVARYLTQILAED